MRNNEQPTYMVGSTGCLITTGQLNSGGYGPHRHRWEREFGPIPEGMDLDHLCRNRWCVNTGHLELVTRKENLRRGKGAESSRSDRSKCRKGLHDWTNDNTFIDSHGKTRCLQCHKDRQAEYRERVKSGRK